MATHVSLRSNQNWLPINIIVCEYNNIIIFTAKVLRSPDQCAPDLVQLDL